MKEKIARIREILDEIEKSIQSYSLEDVRGILADKARLGYQEEIKSLLEKYGADRLSNLDPKNYEKLLKDVKELGNGE